MSNLNLWIKYLLDELVAAAPYSRLPEKRESFRRDNFSITDGQF